MEAKELFSLTAEDYARFRPKYPDELFKFLNSIAKEHISVWDCATGNGQAAIGLTPYFNKIFASDTSKEQIANSISHPKIKYFIADAENSGLPSKSMDLITVATAIHWFDKEKFFKEVKRICKPGGIFVFWNYTNQTFTSERIDKIIYHLNEEILSSEYWPDKALSVFKHGYKYINAPFENIEAPEMNMEHHWSLDEFNKYLFTWSGVQAYIKRNNVNPIDLIYKDLAEAWGDKDEKKKITWKLLIKVYRI